MVDYNAEYFDKWREDYDKTSIAEQAKLHDELFEKYPQQAHYDYAIADNFFEDFKNDIKVFEAGCWDLTLAKKLVAKYPNIVKWKGADICQKALKAAGDNERIYKMLCTTEEWWWSEHLYNYDIFIATHFIEHLSNEHLESLLTAIPCSYIYLEAPLKEVHNEWGGYMGTHKLEFGWKEITHILRNRYHLIQATNNVRIYRHKREVN